MKLEKNAQAGVKGNACPFSRTFVKEVSEMNTRERIILVTGATGKQGGAVARHLMTAGWAVRAFTRNPDGSGARDLRIHGAEIVQ
ncbi:MAG: NmrA family NAD(P)-binding protein, partial [Thermodesulfobacteriota bacterium]